MNKNNSQNLGFVEVILLGVVVVGIAVIAGLWWYQGRVLDTEDGTVSPTVVPTVASIIETPTPSVDTPTPTTTDVDISDMDQVSKDINVDDFGDTNLSDTSLGL